MAKLGTLTDRQREVLTAIIGRMANYGIPPSYRELQADLKIKSGNAVHEHIEALQRKGYLRMTPKCARSLVVLYGPDGTQRQTEVSHA